MEWDSYTVGGIDSTYDIVGVNPLNAIPLNPNSAQNVDLIVVPKNPKSLLVTVKDSSTGLPVTNATVVATSTSGYFLTQTTDRGYINQTDWSGGEGQEAYTDITKYFSDDGNIDTNNPMGGLVLKNVFGLYNTNGVITTSTIDTGSASNFGNFVWSPTDQPPATGADSVKFQMATSASSTDAVWTYTGPDGTGSTYYTLANSAINALHNGDRYVRYKAFLSTASSTFTPNLSDIAFTYTSSCTPPGQVVFSGLSSETYTVSVSKVGYNITEVTVPISNDWTEVIVTLSPE